MNLTVALISQRPAPSVWEVVEPQGWAREDSSQEGRGARHGRPGPKAARPRGPVSGPTPTTRRVAGGVGRGRPPGEGRRQNPPPARSVGGSPWIPGRGRDRNLERDSGKRLRGGGVRPVPATPVAPRYLGCLASPLSSGCQPRAHPPQPGSAATPPHPWSALATRMRAAGGPFGSDGCRRAKAREVAALWPSTSAPRMPRIGPRGLLPERWSKSLVRVRAPSAGPQRRARARAGRGHQVLVIYPDLLRRRLPPPPLFHVSSPGEERKDFGCCVYSRAGTVPVT